MSAAADQHDREQHFVDQVLALAMSEELNISPLDAVRLFGAITQALARTYPGADRAEIRGKLVFAYMEGMYGAIELRESPDEAKQ